MKFKTITTVSLEYVGQKDNDRIVGIYNCNSIQELQNYLGNTGVRLSDQQIYRHSKKATNPVYGFFVKNKNNVIYDFEHRERIKNACEICVQIMRG